LGAGGPAISIGLIACFSRYLFLIQLISYFRSTTDLTSKKIEVLPPPYLFETQFFPNIYFFAGLMQRDIVLEQHEHYQKRSFRNKCMIANAQGIQALTVPLKGGKHQQQPILDVQIAYDEPWVKNHLRSIVAAYSNSPYFEHYFPQIEALYTSAGTSLFTFNLAIINYFQRVFQTKEILLSQSYEKDTLLDDRRGHNTLKNHKQLVPNIRYNQVFEDRHPFIPNLSILDLLFCTGPAASHYLQEKI